MDGAEFAREVWVFAALLFTLVMATLPPGGAPPTSDKVPHIIAFFVLTIVYRMAYPRV